MNIIKKTVAIKRIRLVIIPLPPTLQASPTGDYETNTAANPPSAVKPIIPTLKMPA